MRQIFGPGLDKGRASRLRGVQAGLSDVDCVAAGTKVGLSVAEVNIAEDAHRACRRRLGWIREEIERLVGG